MSVAEIKNSISKMADFSKMDDAGKKRFIELFVQKIYLYDSDDGFRIRTVLSVTNPVDSLDISDFPDFSNITGRVPSPPLISENNIQYFPLGIVCLDSKRPFL